MKVQRTLPPAAALLNAVDLLHGAAGMLVPRLYEERLKKELREYFKTRNVFLVSSGKAALFLILKALAKLVPGRTEVLIPAYTCWSVPSAIVKAGLTVAACDIDSKTFDFDHAQLGSSVTNNTLCIVPGNLFGIPSDTERVRDLALAKGCYVVEDAAQAMGVSARSRKIGTRGDVGFFSLGRGKNITSGSGGIIVTNSDLIAQKIAEELAHFPRPSALEQIGDFVKAAALAVFIRPRLYWLPAGMPSLKLGETCFYRDFPVKAGSGLQAGLLRQWGRRLERSNARREENTKALAAELGLTGVPTAWATCLRFPVMMWSRDERDRAVEASREAGLGIAMMYPAPVNGIEELKGMFEGKKFRVAEEVAERLLTLPTHELTTSEDRWRIVEALKEVRGV